MKRTLQNIGIALTLLLSGNAFGQSCEMTAIEEDLYSPSLIMTCDFNGDGSEDIVFLDSVSFNVFWKRNTGSDNFAAAVPLIGGAEMKFLKAADMNGDGYDEIIIVTSSTIYYIVYTGPTTIDFAELYTVPVLHNIDAIAIGDFNVDGSEGMVFAYSRPSTLRAYADVIVSDDGDLSLENIFESVVGEISDLAVGDITGNRRPDIAMGGYNNFWFRNTGIGAFTEAKVISSGSGDFGHIAIHDYDGDDDAELIVLDYEGVLKAYGIDLLDEGWRYDPITLRTGLPTNPQTWEHTSLNGSDVLLLSSDDEIIGLSHIGRGYTEISYCSGISDLNGLALFHREDGLIEFVLSRESEGTIEKINDAETNSVDDIVVNPWEVYPNPTRDLVYIVAENNAPIENVQVINTFGQISGIKTMGNNQYSIQDLASGLYQLVITDTEGNVFTKSVLKID